MTDPTPASPGFATDVRPLFRQQDRDSMLRAFDLWNVDDVRRHQDAIFARLADGTMPCDGAWPPSDLAVLRAWIDGGSRP
ncbi:hypothetical protein EDF64_104234 [Curtobacterium flaccumfaciens]|uniref:Uncharacterized protein n=1 Tax=Curtobacterium flaccumfaciens TaxID=2035 RepID=A0A4R6DJG0_9MICO|nr:hypothetical protein [Curtobacterium flaccumfaciens]TDN44830.1 hypothetical protein EDF64_104234 [Curtobacterium flaccumfaciens]